MQKKLGANYEVFNLAIPGWGIDQMYQAYTKYVEQIAPDQVIFFYIDDDISRTIEAFFWGAGTKNSYQLTDNGLLTKRKPTDGLLNRIESFFVFNSQIINRLYKCKTIQKAKPLAQAILKKVIDAEKKHHRKLAITRFPRVEQIGSNTPQVFDLQYFMKKNECNYLDLEKKIRLFPPHQYLDFYISDDGHLSEKGTKYVADILIKTIIRPAPFVSLQY